MARVHEADSSGAVHPCAQPSPRKDGVSLAEMLIIVLVVSIVAMASLPLIGNASREARLSGATAEVVAALEYAQSCAASSGTDVRVRFPDDEGIVVVERLVPATDLLAEDTLIPEALVEQGVYESVPHPLEKRTNAFVFVTQEDGYPTITAADFEGTNAVVFGRYGKPSAKGTIELTFGDHRRTIKLGAQMGRIAIGE